MCTFLPVNYFKLMKELALRANMAIIGRNVDILLYYHIARDPRVTTVYMLTSQ